MKRVLAATAVVATTAAPLVLGATSAHAAAQPRPHEATVTRTYQSGAVVSVVKCTGPGMATPISAPLPTAATIAKNEPRQSKQTTPALASYSQVYSCTVVVLRKMPPHQAGCAATVTHHHSAKAATRPLRPHGRRHCRRGHASGRVGTAVVAVVAACRPHRPAVVNLNAGYGGVAQLVAHHHPAGRASHRVRLAGGSEERRGARGVAAVGHPWHTKAHQWVFVCHG